MRFLLFLIFLASLAGCSSVHTYPRPWLGVHVLLDNREGVPELEKSIPALSKLGVNALIVEVDYNFDYRSHPELPSADCITREQARHLAILCRQNGIRPIPQINCLGHQSWAKTNGSLLAHHPDLDETPGMYPDNKGIYCRSWCPSNPEVNKIIFSLMDELIEAFDADAFHVGMDEVFIMADAHCPLCHDQNPADLFAKQVNAFHHHLVDEKHVQMMMWADRLLDAKLLGYSKWEASANGTAPAIDQIPRDIVLCDWHYEKQGEYKSIAYLLGKGFSVWPAGWKDPAATEALLSQSIAQNNPRMLGYLSTTWYHVPLNQLASFPPTILAVHRLMGIR